MNKKNLAPKEIVAELDRFIVGQAEAKKSVAIALRNRWRRQQLPEYLKDEVLPKNILMIGPTGVGKTEIARRLSKLVAAPFIKVEATKFTEVGYVGRDVEQIIRDLVEISLAKTRTILRKEVEKKAKSLALNRVLNTLVGNTAAPETRKKFKDKLLDAELDEKEIEIEVADNQASHMPTFDIPGMPGAQMGMLNLGDMIGKGAEKKIRRKLTVKRALHLLTLEESDQLLDDDVVIGHALDKVTQEGIVFLDEIDKICARSEKREGGVSREGVQRDLLPLIEGTTVSTKYGTVDTNHILFIASGAFHISKPSDLLPELQGRLPNRVEMASLTEEDFVCILTEPETSLIKQYIGLLSTENVTLDFQESGIKEIAHTAALVNENVENIGARRLHTVLEKLLEEISFYAPENGGVTVTIDSDYVKKTVSNLAENTDLSKFIL